MRSMGMKRRRVSNGTMRIDLKRTTAKKKRDCAKEAHWDGDVRGARSHESRRARRE